MYSFPSTTICELKCLIYISSDQILVSGSSDGRLGVNHISGAPLFSLEGIIPLVWELVVTQQNPKNCKFKSKIE
jgi:hypothetical protein